MNPDFTVLEDIEKYTQNVIYACRVLHCHDSHLEYSLNLRNKNNFELHKLRIDYLKQFSHVPEVEKLIQKTEERIEKFLKSSKTNLTH